MSKVEDLRQESHRTTVFKISRCVKVGTFSAEFARENVLVVVYDGDHAVVNESLEKSLELVKIIQVVNPWCSFY